MAYHLIKQPINIEQNINAILSGKFDYDDITNNWNTETVEALLDSDDVPNEVQEEIKAVYTDMCEQEETIDYLRDNRF